MVDYEPEGGGHIGCVLIAKANGKFEGELTIEQLEEIDDVMLELGSSRTGQRVGVNSTQFKKLTYVEYAYQESLHDQTIKWARERLDAFTDLEDPYITVDVSTAEFVDRKSN